MLEIQRRTQANAAYNAPAREDLYSPSYSSSRKRRRIVYRYSLGALLRANEARALTTDDGVLPCDSRKAYCGPEVVFAYPRRENKAYECCTIDDERVCSLLLKELRDRRLLRTQNHLKIGYVDLIASMRAEVARLDLNTARISTHSCRQVCAFALFLEV